MKSQIEVAKYDGKNVIGTIKFETKNRRQKVVQIWKRKFNDQKFYVVSGTQGVFGNYEELKNNFVALKDVTESEILSQLV